MGRPIKRVRSVRKKTFIEYPGTGAKVPRPSFFATGLARSRDTPLIGILSKDGTLRTYPGLTKQQQPERKRWVIFFNVPPTERRGTFTLRIYRQMNSGAMRLLATSQNIKIRRVESTPITIPSDYDQCCANAFWATGWLDGADTAIDRATMQRGAGAEVRAAATPSEGNTWFADWNSLTESDKHNTYTLKVWGNGGGFDTKHSLDLKDAYCL